jgi:hypothetical protein
MLGFTLWSRITGLWPRRSSVCGRPAAPAHVRPGLEQLVERILLSGIPPASPPGPAAASHQPTPAAWLKKLKESDTVTPVDTGVGHDHVHRVKNHPGEGDADSGEYFPYSPGSPGQVAAGTDPGDGGHASTLLESEAAPGFAGPVTVMSDEVFSQGLSEALQELLIARGTRGQGDEQYETSGAEHVLNDQSVLAYLLRPYIEEHDDRRGPPGDTGPQAGVVEDDAGRPEANAAGALASERIDGPGIARSMAAVFREQPPGEQTGEEVPAGKVPDLLVSYSPDLPAPQAELLPLEDGSRALVAALVAGVPGDNPDTSRGTPANAEPAPTGSPVGLDSGPPPASPPVAPVEIVPAIGGTPEVPARPAPAAAGDKGFDPEQFSRPAFRLLDALFAAGACHLYWMARVDEADDRRREKSR